MRTVDRDNVIITHDSGSPREQMMPFWETTAAGSYMGWGKSTQLGYGLGITMGAKLAAPNKLCVNVMGDAAIGMTGMDIETASRNKIAILTVVFNNGVMGAERDVLKISDKKYGAMTVGGNYTKVAEGLNVAARRVEKPADIVPAIKEAVGVTEKGAPFLLEIRGQGRPATSRATRWRDCRRSACRVGKIACVPALPGRTVARFCPPSMTAGGQRRATPRSNSNTEPRAFCPPYSAALRTSAAWPAAPAAARAPWPARRPAVRRRSRSARWRCRPAPRGRRGRSRC